METHKSAVGRRAVSFLDATGVLGTVGFIVSAVTHRGYLAVYQV